ncbi:MAG: branched-chain amino acid ABC transporter permease [Pseudomonadota bacterium]
MIKRPLPLLVLALLLVFPLVVTEQYYRHLLILALMWVTIGTGWNILAGYTGQVSFGAAAFFGVGAYVAGIISVKVGVSAWWGFLLGPLACAVIAVPFGLITFPLRGAYFALGSLALGEIFRHTAVIWRGLTDGMVGILIMPSFRSKLPYYYIALALAAGSIVILELLLRSRWGYYFISIREDQDAASSLGIDTTRYKMISLTLHAVMTGLAGALYMNYMGFIDPKVVFNLHDISIMAILVVIIGGVGTVYGPLVGAFIMVGLQEVFRTAGFGLLDALNRSLDGALGGSIKYVKDAHVLAFGLLVVIFILTLPNGLVGDWKKITRLFGRTRAAR